MLQKWIKRIFNATGFKLGDKMQYFQTGDVLYFRINEKISKEGFEELKTNLIHKGQNHHHTIEGNFKLYLNDKGDFYIRANSDCRLNHEEHKTITLPKGLYKKGIVVEYDHWEEESREVID